MIFRLPHLTLSLAASGEGLQEEVRRALGKFSCSHIKPSLFLVANLCLASAGEEETAWPDPLDGNAVLYQFVQGVISERKAFFRTAEGSVLTLDHRQQRLFGAIHPSTFTAPYSTWSDLLSAPLAEYWRIHGYYPLHAGAVGFGSHTVLLPGASGSGKTTLSLALLKGGATWRADDKVLFSLGNSGAQAVSIYQNTNLHPQTISSFPELGFALYRSPIDETNEKRACSMKETAVSVDLSPFTPTAIVFPVIGDLERSVFRPLPGADAFMRLAGQSPLSPLRSRAAAQISALAGLIRGLPALEVRAGRDVLGEPASFAARFRACIEQVRAA